MKKTGRISVFILAVILVLTIFVSAGCTAEESQESVNNESGAVENAALETETENPDDGSPEESAVRDEIPYGSPFCTTIDSGNLPAGRGTPADDLNVYYNYDFFREHAEESSPSIYAASATDDFKNNIAEYVQNDGAADVPGIDQLKLFWKQAEDLKAADERGLSDIQPYLDMIDSADSIEEFNEVLSSEDFPFSPFVTTVLSVYDMSAENIYELYPNFLVNDFMEGAEYMQDAETKDDKVNEGVNVLANLGKSMLGARALMFMGKDEKEATEQWTELTGFEKQYGKHAFYSKRILEQEYGELGQFYDLFTLDELQAGLDNFPVRGILEKDGRDKSRYYMVMCSEWMKQLDSLWTEENLGTLKTIAKAKIILECAPYLGSELYEILSFAEKLLTGDGEAIAGGPDNMEIVPSERAYTACDSLDTFSQLLAEIYIDRCVGETGIKRIREMAENLRNTYTDIFERTGWLDDESREALMSKLEDMRFNVLEPESGYFDYGSLRLVPEEEGGSLVGNYLILKKYRIDRENMMIGQAADSGFIFNIMKPSTVNCFYSSEGNCINILPGFVNSAFYDDSYSEEELLGGLGYVVAHEISHAFDNIGSQYDSNGVLNCCFTEETLETYLGLCDRIKEYYDKIYVVNGRYVDGGKVLAEACADLCGMQAITEYSETLKDFDYDKFYKRIALDYRDIAVPRSSELMLIVDTHPLSHLRINVDVQMTDKFYEVFDVKEGDNMYVAPEDRLYLYGK